jgi:NAD+ kinase
VTAYSLAAGGPIVSPECNVLVLTPICAQGPTNRSIVVNSTESIEMSLSPGSGNGMVQVDGMDLTNVTPASNLVVQTSRDRVPIAFLPEINYYDVLGRKLKWFGDWEA